MWVLFPKSFTSSHEFLILRPVQSSGDWVQIQEGGKFPKQDFFLYDTFPEKQKKKEEIGIWIFFWNEAIQDEWCYPERVPLRSLNVSIKT